MARNTNRPSNNNRRARNNMSSFIPQARQSIQDNPLRQLNLRNANTRIETNGSDFSWSLLGNIPEQSNSFWAQVANMNNGVWLRDHPENPSSGINNNTINITGANGESYWMFLEEYQNRQRWERESLENLYESEGISWRDIPVLNPIDDIPPEPGNIGGPFNNESLNESFRRLSDAGEALAQSLEEMAPQNSEFSRLAQRIRELQSSSGMAAAYGRSRRVGRSGLSGIADGQYIRYGTPGEEPDKVYGERMDNIIIIQNDSSPLMSWIRESQGWGRGYVIVRKSSYLYHMDLEEVANLFQVHGGITCQSFITPMDVETWGKYLHLTDEDLDHLILGFDTSHSNNEGFKTREQVLEETRNLQLQIASYG